jgi:hypothetical protein
MTTLDAHEEHRQTAPAPHEHGWLMESVHAVSTGHVFYVRCAECGARRVDQQGHRRRPPVALSRELPRDRATAPARPR